MNTNERRYFCDNCTSLILNYLLSVCISKCVMMRDRNRDHSQCNGERTFRNYACYVNTRNVTCNNTPRTRIKSMAIALCVSWKAAAIARARTHVCVQRCTIRLRTLLQSRSRGFLSAVPHNTGVFHRARAGTSPLEFNSNIGKTIIITDGFRSGRCRKNEKKSIG